MAIFVVAQAFSNAHVMGLPLLSDVLIMLFIGRSAVGLLLGRQPPQAARKPIVALGCFFATAWLALAFTGELETAAAFARISLYGALFVAASCDREGARATMISIALFASLEALLGILGLTPRVAGRLYGLYGDPGQTGLLLLAGYSFSTLLPQPWKTASTVLTAFGIVLTQTRSTAMALIVATLAWHWPRLRRGRLKLAVVAIMLVLIGWWLIPIATERFGLNAASIALREKSWWVGFSLIAREPLVGHGWAVGGLPTSGPGEQAPYNLWLNVAASTGLVSVAFLALFTYFLLDAIWRSDRRECSALIPFLLGFLVQSLGEMTFYAASASTIAFFGLTGIAAGALEAPQSDEDSVAAQGGTSPSPAKRGPSAPIHWERWRHRRGDPSVRARRRTGPRVLPS
ncbi:MAG: O-antigen ligase family protein [Actinomycetota bacterium]